MKHVDLDADVRLLGAGLAPLYVDIHQKSTAAQSAANLVGLFADDLADLEELQREAPLALWRAWDRDKTRTSQRRALQLLEKHRKLIVLGGNRSGKTEMMRAVLVALALGSDHPIAHAFWTANGCDPKSFPKGPATCYIVARTSNDSLRYHRKQIDRLLGKSNVKWWNKNGRGEARCEIEVPGYDKPAEIWFKSEDQGDGAMQGDSCRAILHDEEGDSPLVWDEASVRLWDQCGWHLMSNTPIKGLTWVYDRFVEKTPDDVKVTYIHTLDNPFLPPKEARKLLLGDKAMAAARLRGEFVTLEGRIYKAFSRTTHVVEPFDIPSDWRRYRTVDFGTVNPFAVSWGALSPDGKLYIYREYFKAGEVLSHHAMNIREAEGWRVDRKRKTWKAPPKGEGKVEVFDLSWADPEDAQQLMQLNLEWDMGMFKAKKAKRVGINSVQERFDTEQLGGPQLVFFDTCPNHIREHEGYIWKPAPPRTNQPDEPLDKNNHTCDTVRYMCYGIQLSG